MPTRTNKLGDARSLLKDIVIISATILIVILLVSLIVGAGKIVVSVASGWAVALLSFVILFVTATMAMGREDQKRSAIVAIIGILKLAVLGAILWWLISRGKVEPIAFMGGFSSIVLALLIEGVRIKAIKS